MSMLGDFQLAHQGHGDPGRDRQRAHQARGKPNG